MMLMDAGGDDDDDDYYDDCLDPMKMTILTKLIDEDRGHSPRYHVQNDFSYGHGHGGTCFHHRSYLDFLSYGNSS